MTTQPAFGQSIISGDVTGTITDPSGAAVASAPVVLTNVNTNAVFNSTASARGSYRFAFVPPGTYKVSATVAGFRPQERSAVIVTAGQPTTVNIALTISTTETTVNVTENTGALQTDNADVATNFTREMVETLPNPGGDLTYVAQTAPGVVMNTQAGYGNFVADGMPATSNLFTINGQNYNDPFFGINNSGASNLLLGSNDIQEANVINSPYSAQYGQYAGSQISYISKSGTNAFHGDAIYMWNGRYLNANQFFANAAGDSRPFNNFNQWATNVNGPIRKNKTFFDVDYEGLRNVLPTNAVLTLIPSPQYESATLANLAATGHSNEIPFYKQVFAVYNGASGAAGATPVTADGNGGCGTGANAFTALSPGVPCALQFRSTPPNLNREYQWSGRVDHTFSDKDRIYIRVLRDNGFQPTYTSPFGATFNDQSNQPQMSGQVSEIHTFGPNTVNQFNGTALFYAALFSPSDPSGALAALPTFVNFTGGSFSSAGAYGEPGPFYFPQGRRVFQYQVIDDLSHVVGRHTFRIGFSWLHDNITDLDFQALAGPINGSLTTNLSDFYAGGGPNTTLNQAFPTSPEAGLVFNTLGGYIADDFKFSDRLTVSLNLRFEHYANPTCSSNCFSRLTSEFTGSPDASAASTAYNQMILAGQRDAYPNTTALEWEPRIGIAFRPRANGNTVIRTGFGVFADEIPGGLAENAAFNAPSLNAFTIGTPTATLAPGVPGSLFGIASAANQALLSQFGSGGTFNSISSAVPGFAAPTIFAFPNRFHTPTYYKWNFEVQQALGGKMVLNLNYVGNHGTHIPVDDAGLNAYCPATVCPGGFAGLPATPANAALGVVQQYLSAGTSSYNGLTVSLQRRLSAGLTFNVNYTWSHAIDDVSNGGVANEPFGILDTDPSVTFAQNPHSIASNRGPSDYDVRHYVSANIVLTDAFRHAGFRYGPNRVFGGWTLTSNWFFRTGLPFTVIDNANLDTLLAYNYTGTIFASPAGTVGSTCNNAVNTPCLNTPQFAPSGALTGFGTLGRNSVYGPHFFDVDVALMKDVVIREHVTFSFGAQAYNIFNHPNFDQPVNDIANPNFGSSIANVGPPTSLLGSFVGAGSSPRFLEIKGLIRF